MVPLQGPLDLVTSCQDSEACRGALDLVTIFQESAGCRGALCCETFAMKGFLSQISRGGAGRVGLNIEG